MLASRRCIIPLVFIAGVVFSSCNRKKRSVEEDIRMTTGKAMGYLVNADGKSFLSILHQGSQNDPAGYEVFIQGQVEHISKLIKQYNHDTIPTPVITDLYNSLGQRVVRVPLLKGKYPGLVITEMHLNLLFGPPNFVSLDKLSGFDIARNNDDSLSYKTMVEWKGNR